MGTIVVAIGCLLLLITCIVSLPVVSSSSSRRRKETKEEQEVEQEHKEPRIFNYIIHIPKTGGTYFRSRSINLIRQTPELWDKKDPEERVQICDQYLQDNQIAGFPKGFYEYSHRRFCNNVKCAAWSIEGDYSARADHTFTTLRDPHSHVLSQYFHCKESYDHRYGHDAIGTLDEWLEYWSNALNESGYDPFEQYIGSSLRGHVFKCYIPVNMQARKLHMNHTLILDADEEVAKQEIRSKFDIIGDNAQMDKTICATVARITGVLPSACDCSQEKVQRILKDGDHGVTNHGNTFETTAQQDEWIKKITEVDQRLYEYAKIIFAEQVAKVEEEFGVKMCDSIVVDE